MKPDPLYRRARLRGDYRATFETEAGARVLADLYRFCLMDQPSFAVDPAVTAFNEGRRRVFLRILGLMRLSDQDVLKLSREMTND